VIEDEWGQRLMKRRDVKRICQGWLVLLLLLLLLRRSPQYVSTSRRMRTTVVFEAGIRRIVVRVDAVHFRHEQ